MAENLNYVRNINEDDNYLDLSYFLSECFDGEDSNCEKYGRLYDWDEFGFFCPEGWHIPSAHDWENLIIATGDPYTSGKKLKSTTDWIEGGNGTDEFGFTALPGGSSSVWLPGEIGVWWSSETEDESNAFGYAMHFYYYSDSFEFSINHKARGTSVRCVKDL